MSGHFGVRAACLAALLSILASAPSISVRAEERSDLSELLSPASPVSLAYGAPLDKGLNGSSVLVQFTSSRCPSLCVNQTFELSAMAAELPADVRSRLRIVAVTVDPARDGAGELAAFAEGLRVDPQVWSFVRSDAIDRNAVIRLLGLPDSAKNDPDQPTVLLLFDARGGLVQRYGGKPVDRGHLAREIVGLDRFQHRQSAAAIDPFSPTASPVK